MYDRDADNRIWTSDASGRHPGGDKAIGAIRILLYIHRDSGTVGQSVRSGVEQRFQRIERVVCPDLQALQTCLRRPRRYGNLDIYVLLADTRVRLEELHLLQPYLDDRKLLLILPDDERSTYLSGFRLYPRFVTLKSDFEIYLYDVLEKMIEYHNRK